MPMITAACAYSTRMPAILAPRTSTSFGHFSSALMSSGRSRSTVSATASAVTKLSSAALAGRHVRPQHQRDVQVADRAMPVSCMTAPARGLFARADDSAVWRALAGQAQRFVVGRADAVVVPDVEGDHGSASSSRWARARFSGSASRATIRCSTERARGSPASPNANPSASRLSNHCGSNGFSVRGRRCQ